MRSSTKRIASGVGGCVLMAFIGLGFTTGSANALPDSCREWRVEHRHWKVQAVKRYLRGAPQRELDDALFELLQREAYLTSCAVTVQGGRGELVGWRLVGRTTDEYGSAVVESVLERAGFDLELDALFESAATVPGSGEFVASRRRTRWTRAR